MWKYNELSKTLAALYYTQNEIVTLLKTGGLSPGDFDLTGRAYALWVLILARLEQMGKVKNVVGQALKEFPENPVLLDVMNDKPDTRKSVYAGEEPIWKGSPSKAELERITGEQSTLLPITFLEMGITKSAAVAKIVTPEGSGTGFLISKDNLLLTNNHVLKNAELAGKSKAQFNYQRTVSGLAAEYEEFEVDKTGFQTSVTDDWSIVKIKGNPAEKYGFLKLGSSKIKKDNFVNIIQHPGGEHKQIGLYHNLVTFVDDRIVQYLTDTKPGSSGSPVFNSEWQVVALHHSGGWVIEPGTKDEVLRNEGININRIVETLKAKGINI